MGSSGPGARFRLCRFVGGYLEHAWSGEGDRVRHSHVGFVWAAGLALAIGLGSGTAAQQPRPGRAEQHNIDLVGFDDLQARSAYQPVIHRQGDRWIAYIGHHGGTALNPLTGLQESNGTSILDVTNPKQPKYLAHIPGQSGQGEGGGAQMVRVCDGSATAARRQEQGVPAAYRWQHRS